MLVKTFGSSFHVTNGGLTLEASFFATNALARNGMHLEHVLGSIEVVSSSRVLAVTQSLMDIDAKK